MVLVKHPIGLVSTFLWIGFVGAISFMEAWLKFQAPGVTLPIGLGIGKLVFQALNQVEWVFAITICLTLTIGFKETFRWPTLLFLLPFCLLITQSIWVLPALNARANLVIQGIEPAASNLHFYYVAMECLKIIALSAFGITLFKSKHYGKE